MKPVIIIAIAFILLIPTSVFALEIDSSSDPTALNDHGVVLMELGRFDDAIKYFDRALLYFSEMNQALANKGMVLYELEEYKESIPYLQKALQFNPNEPVILMVMGDSLFQLGKHEEALTYYDKVLSIDPNDLGTMYRIAVNLSILDRFEESLFYFDKILPFFPNDENVIEGRLFVIQQIEKTESTTSQNNGIVCGKGTVDVNGQCVPEPPLHGDPEPSSKGGGCLIATATYGSELAPQVQQLRELRDNSLLQTESGTSFMELFNDFYYSFSSYIADYERENPIFKEMVKIAITPMITSLSILNYVDMDSEESVLGYGISLIMLNVMMYVGIPILAIMKIRK